MTNEYQVHVHIHERGVDEGPHVETHTEFESRSAAPPEAGMEKARGEGTPVSERESRNAGAAPMAHIEGEQSPSSGPEGYPSTGGRGQDAGAAPDRIRRLSRRTAATDTREEPDVQIWMDEEDVTYAE